MKRALFSVSDKTGVAEFARALKDRGWEVIATGGTQQLLEREGIATTGISEVTGFPEICDGRVKTLHPAVHGALLAGATTGSTWAPCAGWGSSRSIWCA